MTPDMANVADNQIGVFLTLETVFAGESPSRESLKSLLAQLNKSDVIVACSRINLVVSDNLNDGEGTWLEKHLRKQLTLAASVFDSAHFPAIEAFVKQHPSCSIFFRGQLLELIRWAALFGQDGESKDELVNDLEKRALFAKALLVVNGLWEKRVYRDQLRTEGDLTTRRLGLLPRFRRSISETAKGPDLTQAFVRGRSIICDGLCALSGEFAESFRLKSGTTLDEYYACLLLIVLRTLAIDTPKGTNPAFALRMFSPLEPIENLQTAFSLMMKERSQSVSELTAALQQERDSVDEVNVSTFVAAVTRSKPIFRVREDLAIVLDPVFLSEMATAGPLFMVDDVDEALRLFGAAFEAYCSEILENMFPQVGGLARRFTGSPKGRAPSGTEVQVADGLLDCGDQTILFEEKAVRIREDKIEGSAEEYIEFLKKKYGAVDSGGDRLHRKGVAQLANSVRHVTDGSWRTDTSIRVCDRIIPVLLVNDCLVDAPLHPWFLAREFALLLDPSIVEWLGEPIRIGRFMVDNLIVVTIDDLEALESSIGAFSFHDLLRDYSAAFPDRMDSLHNYIAADRRYGNAIIYSERVRKRFSRELRELGARAGLI